jgi:hypothetical protein
MEELAIMTGHLTPRLLKKEIDKMGILPEKILVTHPKPQYFRKINREIEGLRMNNIKMLKEGKIYEI